MVSLVRRAGRHFSGLRICLACCGAADGGTPILQLSLFFRLFLLQLINRDYEVMNAAVVIGALTAVFGSMLVSIDTDELTALLNLPHSVAEFLRYRLSEG